MTDRDLITMTEAQWRILEHAVGGDCPYTVPGTRNSCAVDRADVPGCEALRALGLMEGERCAPSDIMPYRVYHATPAGLEYVRARLRREGRLYRRWRVIACGYLDRIVALSRAEARYMMATGLVEYGHCATMRDALCSITSCRLAWGEVRYR